MDTKNDRFPLFLGPQGPHWGRKGADAAPDIPEQNQEVKSLGAARAAYSKNIHARANLLSILYPLAYYFLNIRPLRPQAMQAIDIKGENTGPHRFCCDPNAALAAPRGLSC